MAASCYRQSVVVPAVKPGDMVLEDFLRAAKEIGLPAVETWEGRREVEALLAAARPVGLAVSAMVGHGTLECGMNRPDQHERIEGELRESIAFAAREGIPTVVVFSGNRSAGQSDQAGRAACAELLRRVAPAAQAAGVALAVEILNSRVDHPGYQCDRVEWAVALCEAVGSPAVKILFDIYHVQIMEGDVTRRLLGALPHVGHIHTAGNPGRHELDDRQELNYRGIMHALAASGYAGTVAHEFMPQGDALQALAAAFTLCQPGGEASC